MYTLYSYYRSSCSWRVRLALELKQIPYTLVQINLLADEQNGAEYIEGVNPLGVVPALSKASGDIILTQSVAIMEYLEESSDDPNTIRLLPDDPLDRAHVRQLVQIIASDCQPLQNLNVLRKFKALADVPTDEDARQLWGRPFILRALHAYTKLIQTGRRSNNATFSFGDTVTMADLCLIPQIYNARRFGIQVELEFPLLHRIELNFIAAHPEAHIRAHPDYQYQ